MSNAENIFSLPLFPLNVVLYPGMILPLHIFETRYKTMVRRCLATEGALGVVLIAEGNPEGTQTAQPRSVGTIANIIQVQQLEEERLNIWVLGSERFELLDYRLSSANYLIGQVQRLIDTDSDPLIHLQPMSDLKHAFKEYIDLKKVLEDTESELEDYHFTDEPALFSYQIAALLDIALAEKQTLLETKEISKRLIDELNLLDREINHFKELLSGQPVSKTQHLPWGGSINLN